MQWPKDLQPQIYSNGTIVSLKRNLELFEMTINSIFNECVNYFGFKAATFQRIGKFLSV